MADTMTAHSDPIDTQLQALKHLTCAAHAASQQLYWIALDELEQAQRLLMQITQERYLSQD